MPAGGAASIGPACSRSRCPREERVRYWLSQPRITLLAWIPLIVLLVAIAALSSESYIKALAIDDALYYPIIARGIAEGLGSTYDSGLTQTNGYHPLWCWMILPVALLCRNMPPFAYLWCVKLLMVGVVAALYAVWYRVIRSFLESSLAATVFLLLLGLYWWSVATLFSMLETPLVILFVGLSLLAARRTMQAPAPSLVQGSVLGAVLALTFLARLDSVFFLACLSLVLLVHFLRYRRWASLSGVAAAGLLVAAPYLIWNQVRFGHPIPVSGQAKTVGIDLAARFQAYGAFWSGKIHKVVDLFGWPVLLAALAIVLVLLLLIRRELRELLFQRWRTLWVLPLSAVLHSLYTWWFMTQGAVSWYHYLSYLSIFLAVASTVQACKMRLRALPIRGVRGLLAGSLLILLAGVLALYAPRRIPQPGNMVVFDMAVWAREHLPAEARFGMYDSGVFRFVSGRPTLSLNGLAGDAELMRLAVSRDLRGMIQRHTLDYIITSIEVARIPSIDAGPWIYTSPAVHKPGRGPCRYVIVESEAYEDPSYDLPAR
jgi:hypothetical protein